MTTDRAPGTGDHVREGRSGELCMEEVAAAVFGELVRRRRVGEVVKVVAHDDRCRFEVWIAGDGVAHGLSQTELRLRLQGLPGMGVEALAADLLERSRGAVEAQKRVDAEECES